MIWLRSGRLVVGDGVDGVDGVDSGKGSGYFMCVE